MARVSKGKLKYLWSLYGNPKSDESPSLTGQLFSKLSSLGGDDWLQRQLDDLKTRNLDDFQYRFQRQRIEPDSYTRFKKRMDEHRSNPYLYGREGKGYYEGCRKLDSDFDVDVFVSVSLLKDPTYLTFRRGKHKPADPHTATYTYDFEASMLEAPGGATHVHAHEGKIHTEGSFDRICEDHITNGDIRKVAPTA